MAVDRTIRIKSDTLRRLALIASALSATDGREVTYDATINRGLDKLTADINMPVVIDRLTADQVGK